MTSISSITKQYAGSLRNTNPQKGGAGGGVLGFLGMGGETADDKKVDVTDPAITADAPAEPSLMDKALSAVGFGNKPEDAATADAAKATAATTAEEDAAKATKAEEDAAKATKAEEDAAKAKAEEDAATATKAGEDAATTAPDNNVSMMDRITSVFKSEDNANDASSSVSNDASSDDGSDNVSDDGSDESSDDTEEDNDVDFEKYARKIQDLRNKYEKLKAEHKKLKEGKRDEPVENNNSEFSKMIASLFAIKGSVAQLEYSMKKHAGQNKYPVEGLGLDDGNDDANDNEEQEKPAEVVSDSGSDSGSGSESEPESVPEVPEVQSPPPGSEGVAPAPVGEIPEIPVNTPEAQPPAAVTEAQPPAANMESQPPAAVTEAQPPAVTEAQPPAAVTEAQPPAVTEAQPPAVTEAQPPAAATPPATTNALFSGGKNHYVHNLKKNKTLRHHKRRNRHQTLRTTQNS
jgi:hypothetical protein